jgi:hypothetical protein
MYAQGALADLPILNGIAGLNSAGYMAAAPMNASAALQNMQTGTLGILKD